MVGTTLQVVSHGKSNLKFKKKPKVTPFKLKLEAPKKSYLSKSIIPSNVFGGRHKFIKMNFMYTVQLATASDAVGNVMGSQLSYRLNNINLPFIGQGADYPLPQGYNQAAQAFSRFKVYAAKIRATFHDPTEDLKIGMYVVDSQQSSDLQGVTANTSDMRVGCTILPLSEQGNRKVTFNRYVDIAKLEGLSKQAFKGDISYYDMPFQLSVATATTDMNGTTGDLVRKRIPKVHFAICPNKTVTSSQTVQMQLNITYYVYLTGKQTIPLSSSTA